MISTIPAMPQPVPLPATKPNTPPSGQATTLPTPLPSPLPGGKVPALPGGQQTALPGGQQPVPQPGTATSPPTSTPSGNPTPNTAGNGQHAATGNAGQSSPQQTSQATSGQTVQGANLAAKTVANLATGQNGGQSSTQKVPTEGKIIAHDAVNRSNNQQTNTLPLNRPAPAPLPTSQLGNMLTSFNALQRLFTSLNAFSQLSGQPASNQMGSPLPASATSAGQMPSLVQQFVSQLTIPSNQAALGQWLSQSSSSQLLSQLLRQLGQPGSQLNQWLKQLPKSQQDDLAALLRMLGEQRVSGENRTGQPTAIAQHAQQPQAEPIPTNMQWSLIGPDGRELKLHVEQEQARKEKRESDRPRWVIRLNLPVGSLDTLDVTASWDTQSLSLDFASENRQLLNRTERATPLLTHRLASMGIETDAPAFKLKAKSVDNREDTRGGFEIVI